MWREGWKIGTTDGYRVSLESDEYVLKLDCGDGCTQLCEYTKNELHPLSEPMEWRANYILIKLKIT